VAKRGNNVTPAQFERLVAKRLESEGYKTRLTPSTNDWGVDIFAERGVERLAVQVKMYSGARPVNRQMVFEVVGAAAFFDCTGSAIATDGAFRADAREAAVKLGVRIIDDVDDPRPAVSSPDNRPMPTRPGPRATNLSFESIWSKHVMPLAGKTLVNDRGLTNKIVGVDWGGVRRVSSTGARGRIPIEPFRWAIEAILEFGSVTRQEINEQYAGRASSGIQLVLAQVPAFEVVVIDGKSTIRLRMQEDG
jgi:restriction system protein